MVRISELRRLQTILHNLKLKREREKQSFRELFDKEKAYLVGRINKLEKRVEDLEEILKMFVQTTPTPIIIKTERGRKQYEYYQIRIPKDTWENIVKNKKAEI